jgi:two-component system sensor histidine kinase AlgZ
MQPALPAAGDRATGEFFIPDICAPRPVFIMVLLAELMVFVYTLADSALPVFNWELLATASLFVLWVVLVSAALLCGLRGFFARLSLSLATFLSLLLVLAVTALSSAAAIALYPQLPRGLSPGWWLLRNLLVAAVLTGIVLRNFYLQHQLRQQERQELLSRLESLRARIRPHFLFNTLNSIASLIMSRPEAAEQAIEDLAELFRASLQEAQHATTVADELRLCKLYLGIEQLRLGDRLRVRWDIDDGVRSQPMPSLVLQPLVENAVYHGISRLAEGGEIAVSVRLDGRRVAAGVENPVSGQAPRAEGNRMALANIEQRLQALYGTEGRLQVEHLPGRYRVRLLYPVGPAV